MFRRLDDVLRLAALRLLVEYGLDVSRAMGLLNQEPRLGDAWPSYLGMVLS
jgi:hypothetical protein